jgi:4-hydroxy-3-polyprenylbenzoate decarboxylase
MRSESRQLVLGITGASGAAYAVRLLEVLLQAGCDVHLSISPSGQTLLKQELDVLVDLVRFDARSLLPNVDAKGLKYSHYQDFMSPIASGSHLTDGMVICPCSGSTISAIASGASNNLIQRAADVHLKERRPLILVPRETPLSTIQLENLKRCAEAGAIVLPAMPGFYHAPRSISDLIDFIVARICDQLRVEHALMQRWGSA